MRFFRGRRPPGMAFRKEVGKEGAAGAAAREREVRL